MGDRPKRVSGKKLVRVLERFGWYVERVKGSHHILQHSGHPRVTLSVPVHGEETLPVGTLVSLLHDAGIAVDDFNREV